MRYVLIIAKDQVTSYATGRSGFDEPVIFSDNPQDVERLRQYLVERSDSVFSVVMDSQDEEHHLETLPTLSYRERKQAIRSMATRFNDPGALTAQYSTLSSGSSDRSWRVGTVQLKGELDCSAWLNVLEESRTLVDAMVPFSLLAMQVNRQLKIVTSVCVWQLSRDKYRLVGFHAGAAVISRHVNLCDNNIDRLLAEIRKTSSFLNRFGQQDEGSEASEKMHATVLGRFPALVKQQLQTDKIDIVSEQTLRRVFSISENTVPCTHAVIINLILDKKSCDEIKLRGQYDSSFKHRKMKHALLAGVACSVGLSAASAVAAVKLSHTYTELQNAVDSQRVILQRKSNEITEAGVSGPGVDALRQSLRLSQQIESTVESTPLHFLNPLAVDLSLYPEVNISSIDWSFKKPDDFPTLKLPALVDSFEYGYSATVSGYLNFEDTELVEAVSHFKSLVAKLNSSHRYQSVTVIEAPFQISDSATTIGRVNRIGSANFTISLEVEGHE